MEGRTLTLDPAFFARSVLDVAPGLLGCVVEHDSPEGRVAVRLTEVEAYDGADDPASHAYAGLTKRTSVMFGPPGRVYVYFTYGMHWCMNLVCLPEGRAGAVLLRAGEVVSGRPLARARRPAARGDHELARGPARLATALGVDGTQNGVDACRPSSALRVLRSSAQTRPDVRRGPRVGLTVATEQLWRFWFADEPSVSTYRTSKPRGSRRSPSGTLGPVRTPTQETT
mgnify:CR=1 FL=1